MRTNILFINKAVICSKLKVRAHGSSLLRLRLKKQKIKKYFFLSFNNLSKTKNLIIKYKNLLFLLNKRIEFFKLKGIKLKYLSNLF